MADRTKIEWATTTWSPITGCSPVSEGCEHCYARRMAQRLKGRYGYPKDDPFRVTFHPDRLDQLLKWKKPRRIFVCSMGDLFHETVTEWQWIEVFDVIRRCITNGGGSGHKFLILTKRPWTMKLVLEKLNWNGERLTFNRGTPFIHLCGDDVWLGVTAENQQRADERIPILLQIPAEVHFVSHEPALGKIDWGPYFRCQGCGYTYMDDLINLDHHLCKNPTPRLRWIITGGETGPGARPMHPDIPRHDRDQCREAGVPFFFKQWGEWIGDKGWYLHENMEFCKHMIVDRDSKDKIGISMGKVGKKKAGRLLDGREWNEYPEMSRQEGV